MGYFKLYRASRSNVNGGSNIAQEEQQSTHLTMQMNKLSLPNIKSTREYVFTKKNRSTKQHLNGFSLTMNISAKNTSAVLTRHSTDNSESANTLSLIPSSKNSEARPTVLIASEGDLKGLHVGHIETQTTDCDVDVTETDENDDSNSKESLDKNESVAGHQVRHSTCACSDVEETDENDDSTSKELSNKYESDVESTLYTMKNQRLNYVIRTGHPILFDQHSNKQGKHTGRHKRPGITNTEVLQGMLQGTLSDLDKQGCFKQPPEMIRQHVLFPQKQEFRMPPLTPIPIFPNDKNEQININPFLPLLNTYRQWPNDSRISLSDLARAGFHCVIANEQLVGCRSCGKQLNIDDFNGNDPYTVHRQMSPSCPAVHRDESTQVNDTEEDYSALQRLQLVTPTENHTGINGSDQIEIINEEHTRRTVRSNIHTDSAQGASSSASAAPAASAAVAAATPHPVITYPPRNPGQTSPGSRRESFRNWPGRAQDIDTLVLSGFYFTGEEDIVRCFHCDIGLAEWDPADDPWVEHARHSPDCPFLRRQRDDQFITNIQRRWAEIYTPKHPHMTQTSTRLASYGPTWPQHYIVQSPERLAEAGFFYTGTTDTVRCHYCDGGLREWEPNDDPWTEHARWFPFCKFVIKVKGLSFIQAVARPEDSDRELDNPTAVTSPPTRAEPSYEERCRKREQENPMLSAAVESIKEFGYPKRIIKKAIIVHVEKSGKREFNASELMEILFKLEEKESSLEADGSDSSSDEINFTPKAMAMENAYLKVQQRCELCHTGDRCMLYVPCGHRITCEPCGKSQTSCSVCFQKVTSCVKTFLG